MLTIYAKKCDAFTFGKPLIETKNVYIFRDKDCKDLLATFYHWDSNKPTKRNKYLTLNCWEYKLVWAN